jgi:hypothetical protein
VGSGVACEDDSDALGGDFKCGGSMCDSAIEYCYYPAEDCEGGDQPPVSAVPTCSPYPETCEDPSCDCLGSACEQRDGGLYVDDGSSCG